MSTKTGKKQVKKQQAAETKEYVTTIDGFWKKYSAQTPQRIKIIDWFILYLIAIIGVQFFYRLVVGDDFPKNAFLTGVFCPLGVIVLLVNIRSQRKNYRQLGEFFLACLVLFVVSINFVGILMPSVPDCGLENGSQCYNRGKSMQQLLAHDHSIDRESVPL